MSSLGGQILFWVGAGMSAAFAVYLFGLALEKWWRTFSVFTRIALRVVVNNGGFRRVRAAVRTAHNSVAELKEQRDYWRRDALWCEAKLLAAKVYPGCAPEGMTADEAYDLRQRWASAHEGGFTFVVSHESEGEVSGE